MGSYSSMMFLIQKLIFSGGLPSRLEIYSISAKTVKLESGFQLFRRTECI